MFAFQDLLEAADSFFNRYINAGSTCKRLGNEERLRQETLDLTGSCNNQLVVFGKFIHTQNSDDILEFFITLEYQLYVPGNIIMFLAYDLGSQYPGVGVQGDQQRDKYPALKWPLKER